MDSFRIWFKSLHNSAGKFLGQFKYWKKEKKKPKRMVSDFSWLSGFAAMEISSQLKLVFKFIDANGDGKISPLELTEILLSLGHEELKAAEELAEVMVKEMDSDGDGFVDLDEFMSIMGVENDQVFGDSTKDIDELRGAFLVFDADKNGVISAKELRRVLISLGCVNCSVKECRRMIKGVDKDGDGFVNFDEFKEMMGAGCNL
ncbi:PREDICTED: probable calcium-binding protein CML18 [Nicotiana attenuata]|uniref:Calcium-binding protein cml10 n=1 Tax=Nicotiana attenuata TaxID=49451 RepID=A0A314KRR0_NICAT|nr:PREDICTED: probable calcium-binding protein CML18 [Nicotiana attenuata]OIT32141.1 putative calcium-binding protein cml10 [Nicotiana attenuata]